MKKLTSLTPEQTDLMHRVRQEWLELALSGKTEITADLRPSIDWLYKFAKLAPPSMVLVLDSPYGCQLTANYLKRLKGASAQVGAQVRDQVWDQVWARVRAQVRAQVGAQVRAQVWAQVRAQVGAQVRAQVRDQVWDQVRAQVGAQVGDQVWDQVWDQVRAQVGAQVGDQVWDQVWAQVGDQVWAQVGAQVRDQVWDQVRAQVGAQVGDQVGAQVGAQVRDQVWAQVRAQVGAQVRDQVGDQVRDQVWGQVWAQVRAQVGAQKLEFFQFAATGIGWDSHWVSFYDFFTRVGILNHDGLNAYMRFLRCGLWDSILLKDVAIVCRRPARVHRDDQNRLHSTEGPSVEWLDGYANYHLHGMRVERDWVEHPEKIDVKRVLKEENIELRRALTTLMGYTRFVAEAKAEVLESDIDGGGQPRRLLKIADPMDEDIYLIEVQDPSTGRQYHLRVPPTMKTCREAVAWGYGMPAELYAPLVEA